MGSHEPTGRLRILEGEGAGACLEWTGPTVRLGRAVHPGEQASGWLFLSEPGMARVHATLRWDGEEQAWQVTAHRAPVEMEGELLRPGGRIRLGEVWLELEGWPEVPEGYRVDEERVAPPGLRRLLGWDLRKDRPVEVWMAGSEAAREGLETLARALGRLDPRHRVSVIRRTSADLLVTGTGTALLADQPLDLQQALEVFDSLCDAVEHAHSRGVLHLGLRAEYVWLEEGGVRLTGFGLGPPVAPELDPGPEADLYGLGVCLHQALAGQEPGRSSNLRALGPDLPVGLVNLVARLLERRPQDRPADVEQVRVEMACSAEPPLPEPPALELDPARAELADRLAAEPGGAVVLGPAGSGRTTFLLALSDRLEAGGETVLWLYGGGAPLEPLDRLWDYLQLPREEIDLALRGGQALAAAELLRSRLASHAGPVALLVDDVERLDATSRAVLDELCRLAPPAGVRWFVAVEPSPGPWSSVGPLVPLPPVVEPGALLEGVSPERAGQVMRESAGHPGTLRILAAWAREADPGEEVPRDPAAAVLAGASEEAVQVARALALAALPLHAEVVASMTGFSPPTLRAAVQELRDGGLVRVDGWLLRPASPAAAQAMAGSLDVLSRHHWRRRLQEAARGGLVPPALRARLLKATGEGAREDLLAAVAGVLDRGAVAAARELYLPDEAAPLALRLRLESPDRLLQETGLAQAAGFLRLGGRHRQAGRLEKAREAAVQGLAALGAPTEPPPALPTDPEAARLAAGLYALLGTVTIVTPGAFLEAAAEADPAHWNALARHRLAGGDAAGAAEAARAALALGETDPYAELEALGLLAVAAPDLDTWKRGAALARQLGRAGPEAAFLERLAEHHAVQGEWEEARPLLERLARLPRDPDLCVPLSRVLERLGGVYIALREYDRVEGTYEDCLDLARQAGEAERAARVCVELGRLALFQGDLDRADGRFREAMERATGPGGRSLALIGLAEAALMRSRPKEVRRRVAEARALPSGDAWVEVAAGRLEAEAAMQELNLQAAGNLARAALETAERTGYPDEAERLARLLQEIEGRRGRLVVEKGPAEFQGVSFTVPPRDIRLGRGGGCELLLPHPSISRLHAAIEWSQGVPYLVPLSPENTTQVNGRGITMPTPLARGDRVRLGDLHMVWEDSGEQP